MKLRLALAFSVFGLVHSATATVTMGFADLYAGGIAQNLANASGAITDGMNWGIVVDTAGNGFANGSTPSSYNAYGAGVTTAGFLSVNGVLTDDYFIPGAFTVNGTTSGYQDGSGRTPGHGAILDDANVPSFDAINKLSQNESFALIWFGTKTGNAYTSNGGDKYGFLTDSTFKMPSDGASGAEYGSPWNGATIPTLSATNTFIAIPEPSRMLLIGLGSIGLIARRRRLVA